MRHGDTVNEDKRRRPQRLVSRDLWHEHEADGWGQDAGGTRHTRQTRPGVWLSLEAGVDATFLRKSTVFSLEALKDKICLGLVETSTMFLVSRWFSIKCRVPEMLCIWICICPMRAQPTSSFLAIIIMFAVAWIPLVEKVNN